MKQLLRFKVNGEDVEVYAEPHRLLAEVLREDLNLTGTKTGCTGGRCGACTVLLDGKAVKSCLILAAQVRRREITTIEGLRGKDGKLDPVQQAFVDHFALQCGFCTPGMIMSARSLLNENPSPTEEEVRDAMEGNLCRCTGYVKIVEAVLGAAKTGKRS